MGAFKNELIADQVEVGDRIPQPMPWYSHASLSRKAMREIRTSTQKRLKKEQRELFWNLMGFFGLGYLTGIATWILVEWGA